MKIQELENEQREIIARVNNLEIPEEVGWQEVLKIQREIEELKTRVDEVYNS